MRIIDFVSLALLSPYLWVLGGVVVVMLLSGARKWNTKWLVFLSTLFVLILGMISSFQALGQGEVLMFNQMLVSDPFGCFFNGLFLGSTAITVLSSFRYLDQEELQLPEYYILLLLSTLGMMLLASSLDLIVSFIALEILSLAVYVLVGFRRADRKSNEAAIKYFVMGGVASALFLYGAALLYGFSHTTQIREILKVAQAQSGPPPLLFAVGAGFVLFGFLFKVASVPFHMWIPDVYEGAPTPITGFMTAGVKAAAFAALMRILLCLGPMQPYFHDILWVCAVATMVFGNLVALAQSNLKRMLAYSSIAHSGYLLVGLIAAPLSPEGYAPLVVYLVAYSLMNLGAFALLSIFASKQDGDLCLHDFSGLAYRHPGLSFCFAVFLFSLAGLPPTAGFAAKYWVFYSAVAAGETPLVVIAVLCSAVSVYYYLRVIVSMYMRESPTVWRGEPQVSLFSQFAVVMMVVLTLQWGLLPSNLLQLAKKIVGF